MLSLLSFLILSSTTPALVLSAPSSVARTSCHTGTLQCCSALLQASNSTLVLNYLGLSNDYETQLSGGAMGINCSSVADGGTCTMQLACCSGSQYVRSVALGCTSVNSTSAP